jgi:hypothetical protein
MGKSTISMAIFHGYVKLPEGKPPFSYGFPMVFPLKPPFSYGFPAPSLCDGLSLHPGAYCFRVPRELLHSGTGKWLFQMGPTGKMDKNGG